MAQLNFEFSWWFVAKLSTIG